MAISLKIYNDRQPLAKMVGNSMKLYNTSRLANIPLLRHQRPLFFYGAIAGVLAIATVLVSIHLALTYSKTGLVPRLTRLPAAVLCTAIVSLATYVAAVAALEVRPWKVRLSSCLEFRRAQLCVLIVLWGALVVGWLIHLPVRPLMSADSPSYLSASEIRPHGYSLFLDFYRSVIPDLSYLPHVQWLILATSSLLLSIAVGWRTNNIVASVIVVFCSLYLGFRPPSETFWLVHSDSLYEALVVSAAACLICYFSLLRLRFLVAASGLLGMALITRTIGYAILPVFVICVALSFWSRGTGRGSVILAATLPLLICCAIGAGSNLLRYGQFRIGSFEGMSLLGKGLVLAQPLPYYSKFKAADWVAETVLPVRITLAQIHNPILKALVVRQYYENLRRPVLLPRFNDRLAGWREASDYERDKLARALAIEYIRNDLKGYSELFALDYFSLWAVPRVMTTSERECLQRSYRALGPLPFLTDLENARWFTR
jgi:hypothetical protein